jgi:hypothetical protein
MARPDEMSPHELLHDIERWPFNPERANSAIRELRSWLDEVEKGLKDRAES